MTIGEPELRSAAEAGDRGATVELVRVLSAAGREAEATYWRNRLDEASWAGSAVPVGDRRYPPVVLVAAALVGVLGLVVAVVVVGMCVIAVQAHDDLLAPVLVVLSLVPAAAAVVLLTSVAGILRDSVAAARRAQAVTASVGGLGVIGSVFLLRAALTYGGTATAVLQALLLGGAVVVPFLGVAALLGRTVPRLGGTGRTTGG